MKSRMLALTLGLFVMCTGSCNSITDSHAADLMAERWWKGNTHTHSLWSDGDGYPEMVADWYRKNGYNFLVLTDHNVPPAERWIDVAHSTGGMAAYQQYRDRFGTDWVDERTRGDSLQVRLKTLDEYRSRLEEPGEFLLVRGEEISRHIGDKAAHMNAINLARPIQPLDGHSVPETLVRNLIAVLLQRWLTGRPMIATINHPNYLWSLSADELAGIGPAQFFELYNGHPLVHNAGDDAHISTERMWDAALTERLTHGGDVLYAVASDDAHNYQRIAPNLANPGRGWVMVRAPRLSAAAIVEAMERGDFYASTGVTLADIRADNSGISVEVQPEAGVSYVIRFIGTREGYDASADTAPVMSGGASSLQGGTHGVGEVLAEVSGTSARYVPRGDELYVRATVVSSKLKANVPTPGEVEMAWTQPVVRPAGGW